MNKSKGKVYLVGAGPGDPNLITVRGRELVESADVILYDALIGPRILEWTKPDAEKIFVGKTRDVGACGRTLLRNVNQSTINSLMLRQARQGRTVVRLKGGDPMIFGRGGEEASYLSRRGVPVEVVPGITAAFGALASLGIPVTHREFASQIALITGHEDPQKETSTLDYQSLARFKGTLIFYMGVSRLEQISAELVRNGKDARTPSLVVRWATTPLERFVKGTLKNIAGKVRDARLQPPCLFVVGEVIGHAFQPNGNHHRPLLGKTVLVTRARRQAGELQSRLEALGAQVILMPTIKFLAPAWAPVDKAIRELERREYDWVIFTSQNGVEFFSERLEAKRKDWRILAGARIACIGPATSESLIERGIRPDLVPETFVAESLFRALKRTGKLAGKRFLLLRADLARPYLRLTLAKEKALVKEVVIYRTRPEKANAVSIIRKMKSGGVDFIPFTSSSSAENFLTLLGRHSSWLGRKTKIISIGPVTTKTLRDHGLKVYRQAKEYTIAGLVDAILASG